MPPSVTPTVDLSNSMPPVSLSSSVAVSEEVRLSYVLSLLADVWLMARCPSARSLSAAALSVTVCAVLHVEVVKVSVLVEVTVMSVSLFGAVVLSAIVTVTSPVGAVASLTV